MQPVKANQGRYGAILIMQFFKKYAIKRWHTFNQDIATARRAMGASK